MKIEESVSEEKKNRWQVVRTDSMTVMPGKIVWADEDTGKFRMKLKDEEHDFDLGIGGMRLVRKSPGQP